MSRRRRAAVIYARVSTMKRSQERSIPRQLAELREQARRRGWDPRWECSDRLSGGNDARPGLAEALAHVDARRAQIFIVHDLDRFGRDTRYLLSCLDRIHAAGGQLLILSLNVDTSTPEGRLAYTMSAAIAEHSRHDTARKVLAGIAHARKKGVRLGRPPAIAGVALARAVALHRKFRGALSWRDLVGVLRKEKLGRFSKGTVHGAVTRELARTKTGRLQSLPKMAPKKPGKKPARRVRKRSSGIT